MKILAVAMLVTATWFVVATILGGCRVRAAAGGAERPAGGEFWSWAQREGGVRPVRRGVLPPAHPLAHIVRTRGDRGRGGR